MLSCLSNVDEFGAALLRSLGQRVGVRTKIETYTEVVLKDRPKDSSDRPDGLIIARTGSREWRALIESKVGKNELQVDQIEKYRVLAKDNKIDCVISISNQFSANPHVHPLETVAGSKSKIPVFHWSWMHILTEADVLLSQEEISDSDQRVILNELRRFLSHESAGVRGFDRMPTEWGELNKLVSSGGVVSAKSSDALSVLNAWHQETRDLALIMSRMTETNVSERLPRKHRTAPSARTKDELAILREKHQLTAELDIPDAAAPIEVIADLTRRCLDVGMTLRAPEDKVKTSARVNWLLRQIKSENVGDVYIRLLWPGRNEPTQCTLAEAIEDPSRLGGDKKVAPHSLQIFSSKRLGARFAQRENFISDLERLVPEFYQEIGSNLIAWRRPAPKIKGDRSSADDVTTEAISEDSEDFER